MTKFTKQDNRVGYSNTQLFERENFKYEIINIEKNTCAFSNKRPRLDSKYASYSYLVWDLKDNFQVHYSL